MTGAPISIEADRFLSAQTLAPKLGKKGDERKKFMGTCLKG